MATYLIKVLRHVALLCIQFHCLPTVFYKIVKRRLKTSDLNKATLILNLYILSFNYILRSLKRNYVDEQQECFEATILALIERLSKFCLSFLNTL